MAAGAAGALWCSGPTWTRPPGMRCCTPEPARVLPLLRGILPERLAAQLLAETGLAEAERLAASP